MKITDLRLTRAFARQCAVALVAASLFASSAVAGSIAYPGPFSDIGNGGSTIYFDVEESSLDVPPARFGEPEAVVDRLDFDPNANDFLAQGLDGGVDFLDVGLSFEASTIAGQGLTSLIIEEFLDYGFLLGGTSDTFVRAVIGGVKVTIKEVNHSIATNIDVTVANTLVERNAADDPISGTIINSVMVDLVPDLAAFGPGAVATLIEVVLNDTLAARSETGTVAFIKKKDFFITPGVEPDPNNNVPEPGTLGLIALASMMGGIAAVRKRLG